MAQAFARSFYKSKAWQQCRLSYISSVNGLCERCLERGRYTPGYIVHHVIYITPDNINDPEVTLNHSNLEYLCLPCHNREHFGGEYAIRDDVMFDEEGNLIER